MGIFYWASLIGKRNADSLVPPSQSRLGQPLILGKKGSKGVVAGLKKSFLTRNLIFRVSRGSRIRSSRSGKNRDKSRERTDHPGRTKDCKYRTRAVKEY
jgi:hypothetical protein